MSSSSTITLLQTVDWAKRFSFKRPQSNGNFNEPAITNANLILQTIVGPPFAWRWNRVITGFITIPGQQDYTIFNYLASTAVTKGWFAVDSNGNSQLATTAGTTGSSAPTWNSTTTGTTTDGTVVWTNQGPINTPVNTTYSFLWVETSSVQHPSTQNLEGGWIEMTSHRVLGLDSSLERPLRLAAQKDDGLGNITFRLMPVPDIAYPIAITLQEKPPLFTSLSQTWAPIPDEYARLYSWGFLSLSWLFADDPRFQTANNKFVADLLATSEGLSETDRNVFRNNWQQITGQPIGYAATQNQGFQGRAA
jgi:hypothetical protein